MKELTTLELTEAWEHRREIMNLMGKYAYYFLLKMEGKVFSDLWSQRAEDVCFGVNEGWYYGQNSVSNYYSSLAEFTRLCSSLYQKAFHDKLGHLSEEKLYGVGSLDYKPFNSQVIEIAEDRKTAKGMWYCNGSYVRLTASGPISFWEWSVYAVDFLWEEKHWKIWHMQNLKDIDTPTGTSWGKPYCLEDLFPPVPEFEAVSRFVPAKPNIPVTLRELYHTQRPFSPWPEVPAPYESFEKTFSYGYTEGV